MTKFVKADFDMGHGSDKYIMYGPNRRFVARFKHHRPGVNANAFVKFLIANMSVEEYFHALEVEKKAPGEIVRERGHVSPNEIKAREQRERYEAQKLRDATPMKLIFV